MYEIADLQVGPDLLGHTLELQRDNHRIRLTMPATSDCFENVIGVKDRLPFGAIGGTTLTNEDGGLVYTSVKAVLVEGWATVEWSNDAFDRDDPADTTAGFRLMERLRELADAVVEGFLDWVRATHRQPWLRQSGEAPETIGVTSLYDEATGERIPLGQPLHHDVFGHEESATIHVRDAEGIASRVQEDQQPSVPSVLLADAEFLARSRSEPRRVILLAAIAAELQVKETLRAKCRPSAESLVELLFDSPRDFSVSVLSLYDKASEAALGISLRADDGDLYKDVKWLFETRNAIAHRGAVPGANDAFMSVRAARKAFEWLAAAPDLAGGETQDV